jgi:hypothetical protein
MVLHLYFYANSTVVAYTMVAMGDGSIPEREPLPHPRKTANAQHNNLTVT